jgi:hypothetical protein
MKGHWALIFFVAGLGAGWLIFGGGVQDSAEAPGNKSAAPIIRKREARPVATPHESKFRTFAKELPKLNTADKETFMKSLAPGDRAAAIEAMLSQVGPLGLPSETMTMLGEILKTWADEDFDGAWAWCMKIESDVIRVFVAPQLLDGLVNKDPERALALHLEMASENPDFSSTVPLNILKQAASKDAASYLELLGKLPFRSGSNGTAMEYAADFDFQQAADGLTALQKSREGKSPPVFSTNFLSKWAARDADAAYAWYIKNPRAVDFENFGSLLEGIEKQGVPGASSVWAADKLNEPGADRDALIRSLTRSTLASLPITINSIAQAMPDTVSRDRFLGEAVRMSYQYNAWVDFNSNLTLMSTPAVRLETLRQLGTTVLSRFAKIPDAQLQQWGFTRQQLEQLQAPGR